MRRQAVWMMAATALAALALGASRAVHATTLYKSIGPGGTILFSDTPPAGGERLLEARPLEGGPSTLTPMEHAFSLLDADADLAHANAQVDLAEHALALARRPTWSHREGLRLDASHLSPADEARVAFYRRNLQAARRALLDRLRERQLAASR